MVDDGCSPSQRYDAAAVNQSGPSPLMTALSCDVSQQRRLISSHVAILFLGLHTGEFRRIVRAIPPAHCVALPRTRLLFEQPLSAFNSPLRSMETSTPKTARPLQTFRLKGISASVFENTSEDGQTFHKVSLQRRYRQGTEWKSSQSLGRDDLPIARLLLQRAWEWILQAEAQRNTDDSKEG